MGRYRVEGRNGRIVFEDVGERPLHVWQRSLDDLARRGALERRERFAIVPLDGSGPIVSWKPSANGNFNPDRLQPEGAR
jgi:hypothetical protein